MRRCHDCGAVRVLRVIGSIRLASATPRPYLSLRCQYRVSCGAAFAPSNPFPDMSPAFRGPLSGLGKRAPNAYLSGRVVA